MNRRNLLIGLAGLAATAPLARLFADSDAAPADNDAAQGGSVEKITKTEAQWRKQLTSEQFNVLREGGTEPSGSSPLLDEHRNGIYVCAGCALPLFKSQWKFHSGTGWPSFYDHIPGHIETKRDFKLLLPRTEYHCARCGGHQGHVFDDGPKPTGKRYCNDGVALNFKPATDQG